jgi:hypothetical protein
MTIKPVKQSVSAIVANNKAAGGRFFDKPTLRFFNDTPGNWSAFMVGPRLFIRNVRHRNGPGCFSHCTLRGQVREVFGAGEDIGPPIKEWRGLRPLQIAKAIEQEATP